MWASSCDANFPAASPPPLLLFITSRFAYMKHLFCWQLILIFQFFYTLLQIRSADKLSFGSNVLLPYSSSILFSMGHFTFHNSVSLTKVQLPVLNSCLLYQSFYTLRQIFRLLPQHSWTWLKTYFAFSCTSQVCVVG